MCLSLLASSPTIKSWRILHNGRSLVHDCLTRVKLKAYSLSNLQRNWNTNLHFNVSYFRCGSNNRPAHHRREDMSWEVRPCISALDKLQDTIYTKWLTCTQHSLRYNSLSTLPLFHCRRRVLYFPWNPWRCSSHRPLSPKTKWPLLTSSTPCHVTARSLTPPPRPASMQDTLGRVFPRNFVVFLISSK